LPPIEIAFYFKFKLGGKSHQVKYLPDESSVENLPLGIQVWSMKKPWTIPFELKSLNTNEDLSKPLEI